MSLDSPAINSAPSTFSGAVGQIPAGFWYRLLAFIIDAILVSIPCLVLAVVFKGFLARFPVLSTMAGFFIVTCFLAIFGSEVIEGKTPGMVLTRIKVVSRQGSPLTFPRSFCRYVVLLSPFLLRSSLLPARTPTVIKNNYELVMAVAGVAIAYLAIFNGKTRQSLHDLATGAFVVDSGSSGSVDAPRFWKPHWAILLGLLAIVLLTQAVPRLSGTYAELTLIQNSVSRIPNVGEPKAELEWQGGHSRIVVTAGCGQTLEDEAASAAQIAAAVLAGDHKATERDYIEIECVKKLQVGLFTSTRQHPIAHTPEEWKAILRKQF